MNNQALEEAIKSDLATLSTFKMGMLSAREFYGPLVGFVLKSSVALLLINACVRLGLKTIGLYDGPISVFFLVVTWVGCLGVSCFMGLAFSQPLLMRHLLQGRLKTESLIKKTYGHLSRVYFGLYTVMYALTTLFVNLGVPLDKGLMDPWFIAFSTLFSLGFSFIVASGVTGFMSGAEFQRLGLGALINVIGEMLAKARRQATNAHLNKDA